MTVLMKGLTMKKAVLSIHEPEPKKALGPYFVELPNLTIASRAEGSSSLAGIPRLLDGPVRIVTSFPKIGAVRVSA